MLVEFAGFSRFAWRLPFAAMAWRLVQLWGCVLAAHGVSALDQCPGAIDIAGVGTTHLVAAQENMPGTPAGPVRVVAGSIVPEMWGRAYFAESCSAGAYNNSAYAAIPLLGKELTYTTDVSQAGCGCNAALYLAPMRQNPVIGGCGDYYCDANSVCNVNCEEINIQEANRYAWHSVLHTAYDGSGVPAGYGGWVRDEGYDWGADEYGPGARCIDTTLPFQVSTAFPTTAGGLLRAMEVRLSQAGQPCDVSLTIDQYDSDPDFSVLTDILNAGTTVVVSYWKSANMLWLDGPGRGGGPCKEDTMLCGTAPQFYGLSVQPLQRP